MLRLWLTRRWILGTLIAIVFAVACYLLGDWQWTRHVEQKTKVTAIQQNYSAAPVPLASALPRAALAPTEQWTRVRATGTYAAGADLMVRNRTLDQSGGFEVLTPFTTSDGLTLLVDRGWVPNADSAEITPPVDPPPTGSVEVVGWLRTGEPSLGRDLPAPQLASISIADARARDASVSDLDAYVVLGSQQPPTAAGSQPVTLLPKPEEGLGPHQAYAYQWWLTMPGVLVFVIWAMRRELALTAASDPNAPVRPVKPKKVRIWDEEDA